MAAYRFPWYIESDSWELGPGGLLRFLLPATDCAILSDYGEALELKQLV